ncbi:hypothetical protein DM02DRAFT_661631 [Periconia macrospinosa]|uniref:Cyanovirin-N domain-containing protein n=1 Tax=Periconia macrospinosa TaxID=97972 RepID=A0A2V1D6U6_9PLEO|nr:hypothetical protein DM02DRAFT_661631 [Periconia macrospinosa]
MQLSISHFASIAAFFATANAVGICTAINPDGSCIASTCRFVDIAVGQTINVPGTNCIFNTVNDPGFDLRICSGANLSGDCKDLQAQPRKVFTGDFNWQTPNIASIFRNGN